jgi:hypothetical protein
MIGKEETNQIYYQNEVERTLVVIKQTQTLQTLLFSRYFTWDKTGLLANRDLKFDFHEILFLVTSPTPIENIHQRKHRFIILSLVR